MRGGAAAHGRCKPADPQRLSGMRSACCALLLFAVFGGARSFAQAAAADLEKAALRALGDGLPEVAARKLDEALREPGIDPESARSLRALLVESSVRGGRFAEALAALAELEQSGAATPALAFWKAAAPIPATREPDGSTAPSPRSRAPKTARRSTSTPRPSSS